MIPNLGSNLKMLTRGHSRSISEALELQAQALCRNVFKVDNLPG